MNPLNGGLSVLDLRKRRENYDLPNFEPRTNSEVKGKFSVCAFLETSEDSSSNSEPVKDHPKFLLNSAVTQKPPRSYRTNLKYPYLSLIGPSSTNPRHDIESTKAFEEFRKGILSQIRTEKLQPKIRKFSSNTSFEDKNDQSYWEKRRKNNEAAKKSRNAKRVREEEIAIRAAFLEHENVKLKYEITCLRNEIGQLRK